MPRKPTKMVEQEKQQDEMLNLPPKDQDPEVVQYYINILKHNRDQRSMRFPEFDGLTYELDYKRNRETAYSFLRPKKNDSDVRVNSGTAEKKIELMLNELLGMNFQPEIRAYNRDNRIMDELSADLTDIVRKTNAQERDDDMYEEMFMDLLTQRVCFLEERIDLMPMRKGTKKLKKSGLCQRIGYKRRLNPLGVYVGNIKLPAYRLQEQPNIVIYELMHYDNAKLIFGDNEKFEKYVRPGQSLHEEFGNYFSFRFGELRKDEVEIITVLERTERGIERQVMINSVLMYEYDDLILPCADYPLTATTVKMISDFFYGKPPIASAKFLASLQDELIVNFIRKIRQSIEPPLGVKTGKTYSRNVWDPGNITNGLTEGAFSRLTDHDGVTNSEYQMLQLVTQKIEEFIGQSSITTPPGEGKMTATQVLELQKEGMKMLGLAVLAVMRMKRDATFLRINTFFEEYLQPVGKMTINGEVKDKYRHFEIDDGRNKEGETVKKYVTLLKRTLSPIEIKRVRLKEKEDYKRTGKKTQYSFMNVEAMEKFQLDFQVIVVPESRDSSSFDQVLFQDRLTQAAQVAQLTGKQLNGEKVIEEYERAWKTRNMFADSPEAAMAGPDANVTEKGNKMLSDLSEMAQGKGLPTTPVSSDMKKTMSNLAGK